MAARRIAAGALNGRGVAELAAELGVTDRHLRRVLERELGVSPVELAQTHRLLLAKQLLVDTDLPVTRIAYASGFQSLRRFNSVFRARYRLSPSTLRRPPRGVAARSAALSLAGDLVRLTLAYRKPFAWDSLLTCLSRDAIPGVELIQDRRYGRTVRLEGLTGVIFAASSPCGTQLDLDVSPALLPALMPLLARLRGVFDLDAEPAVIDAHLTAAGLGAQVRRRPGLRLPGAFDGWEAVFRALMPSRGVRSSGLANLMDALAEPFETGDPALCRLIPEPQALAQSGVAKLLGLGLLPRTAEILVRLARAMCCGALRLEPGSDAVAVHRTLRTIDGIDERLATRIVRHALHWPDAFDSFDRTIQRAAGAADANALLKRSEQWRPWRAYAALHLWMSQT
jgi:AraC family transcriptional regulator of adaptative response / DNA-3-methyladenine glycosylase II